MTVVPETLRAQMRSLRGESGQAGGAGESQIRTVLRSHHLAQLVGPGPSAQAAASEISPQLHDRGHLWLPFPAGNGVNHLAVARSVSPHARTTRACAPQRPQDPKLYSSDFSWNQTLPEIEARFEEIYGSDKRLPKRAYWNEQAQRFELPHSDSLGGPVVLAQSYIDAVASHIEAAFENGYVDAVFFPDMGHSHLLIPNDLWETKYNKYPIKKTNELYGDMFSDPRLQTFYHTAEQLKTREEDGSLVADPRTQHRYRTRNISGLNRPGGELQMHQNPSSRANTVHDVPGYRWWGAGFNISANKDGCFPYSVGGKTYYFDISLYDLVPGPGANSHQGFADREDGRSPPTLRTPLEQKVHRIYVEREKEQTGQ